MLITRNRPHGIIFMVLSALLWAGSSHAMLYMWKDTAGVAHYTNKEYEIPQRYRSRVKLLYPDAGDLSAGQPTAGQSPATPVVAPPAPMTQPAAPPPSPVQPVQPAQPAQPVQPVQPPQARPTPPGTGDQTSRGGKSRVEQRRERKLRTYQGGGPSEE